jgi:hypothetical protein
MCIVCLTLNRVSLSRKLRCVFCPIHLIYMSTLSYVQTCEIEPVENDVCTIQNDCGVLEVDIQQHLVFGTVEASVDRDSMSV